MPSRDMKPYKQLNKELSADDTQAINSMVNAALKNLGGRPATYPYSEAGLATLIENSLGYFEYVAKANKQLDEKKQLILDVDSYALFLGISKKTLSEYEKRGGEWARSILLFKDAIAASKKQLIFRGVVPPMVAIFDLVNNHNYYNTNSFVLETKAADDSKISEDNALEERIRQAGLIWDDTKGEFVPER